MVKIFVRKEHRELEVQINNWICSNSIKIVNFSHSTCVFEDEIVHSVLINYESDDSRPC